MGQYAPHLRTDWFFPRRFLLLMPGLVLLCIGHARAQESELRTWTSGEYKVKAKYVSSANGKVTLEQADGEVLEIELNQLSAADRKYVADQQQKAASNPFRKKAQSPFQRKSRGAPRADGAMSPSAESGSEGLVTPNWSGVRQIAAIPRSTGWTVPVVVKAPPAAAARMRPVPIPPTTGFFQNSKGVVLNGSGTRALTGYAGATPGRNQSETTQVVICDLEKGALLGSAGQTGLYAPLALTDDASQVLMRTDVFGPGKHDRLELWNLGKSGIVKGDQWIPYAGATGGNGGDRDVRWAAFLDGERFATISEAGNLVIWQVKPLKPLATLSLHGGCTPGLSPDRKLLAFTTEKEIGVLDLPSLEVIALQPAPTQNMSWTSFSFSPTGKRLACKTLVTKVFVYEVADGTLHREISLHGLSARQTPAVFTDDDHLIVADHTLIDLETQVRLWDYQGNERVVAANGVCWFEIVSRQRQAGGLIPAKVPTAGVQESLTRAMRDPNFFIVKPGSSVSIELNGIPDASRQNEVIQSLTANLSKIGVRVAAGSPVTLQASIEQGKEEEISYRKIGGGFGVERFKVHPWISRIKLVYGGQTAWESGGSSVPVFEMTHLKKGETLQDHVRKLEQPNYAYFANLELPKLVTRPTGQGSGTLGVSTVTLAGIR
jgi:SLA1 homology domain 1, SHD1